MFEESGINRIIKDEKCDETLIVTGHESNLILINVKIHGNLRLEGKFQKVTFENVQIGDKLQLYASIKELVATKLSCKTFKLKRLTKNPTEKSTKKSIEKLILKECNINHDFRSARHIVKLVITGSWCRRFFNVDLIDEIILEKTTFEYFQLDSDIKELYANNLTCDDFSVDSPINKLTLNKSTINKTFACRELIRSIYFMDVSCDTFICDHFNEKESIDKLKFEKSEIKSDFFCTLLIKELYAKELKCKKFQVDTPIKKTLIKNSDISEFIDGYNVKAVCNVSNFQN